MRIERLCWLVLLTPALCHAGYLYTFRSFDMTSGEPLSKTEIRIQGDHLRIDHVDEYDAHDVVLFDGARVQHIDWQHRDYWLLEKSTLDHFSLHGTTQAFRDYIIAQAPPEQRAVVAVTVGGGNVFAMMIPNTPVKLHATPRSGRTGQWGCHVYEGRTAAGDVVREYCVTHYERVDGSRELMAQSAALNAFMLRTLKLLNLPLELDIAQHAFGHFSLNRFPVIQRDLDGEEHAEKRLIEVKSAAFDPDVFTLPPGLRRVAPFAFYTDDGSSDEDEDDVEPR